MALECSERLLRQAQHIARFATCSWDVASGTIEWSSNASELLAVDAQGTPTLELFYGLVHPDDRDRVRASTERLSPSAAGTPVDFRIRTKDGAARHLRMTAEAIRDSSGKVGTCIATLLDRTEQRRAEEALRDSEARWQSLTMNPFDYVALVDRRGVFRWVNHTASGVSEEDLIGKATVYDYISPEYRDRLRATLDRVFEDGHPAFSESYSEQFDTWFASTVTPIFRDGKPVLASFLSRDISGMRRTEAELRRREQLLAEAQRIAGFGSWYWESKTGKVECSAEIYRITGVDPGEAPKTELWESLIHVEDVDRMLAVAHQCAQGEVREPQECRIRRKSDGALRHVVTAAEALRDANGAILGILGMTLDVTKQRDLEADLALSRKLEAVGRLAGGVAHDFNNVLTAILCNVELAARDLPPDAPELTYLDGIRSSAQRASGLTRQLLAFARRQIVSPRVIAPIPLIESVTRLFKPLLGAEVRLVLELAPDAWSVYIDSGQFEQLLMNLAVNARDAMPSGGTLRVEVRNVVVSETLRPHPEVAPGEYVVIIVSDTGCGIAPELQAHVFEPFFTTKPLGQGTGLGLATCYGIVKQNQGHIWLESELERGTRVFVYLPRTVQRPGTLSPPRARVPGGPETILVVEDEPDVRVVCARQLRDLGYHILEASSGAQALEHARSHAGEIHLLLTDVMLPDLRGPDVVALIADTRPDAKVLYMSGYTEDTVINDGVLDENVNFLHKPFTVDILASAVRAALDRGRSLGPKRQDVSSEQQRN